MNKRIIRSNDEGGPTGPASFNTVLYTGNGGTLPVADVGFEPDFVWIKSRNDVGSHIITDSVRGNGKEIYPDLTNAEGTVNRISLTDTGFDVNSVSYPNKIGDTYVAWCWKAGGAAVTNTDGTITSQVSANTEAGFSIVTWTGLGDNGQTVGHGLGTPPQLIITKCRNLSGENWYTYSEEIGNTKFLALNLTSAARTATEAGYSAGSNFWNDTSPTSSVFSLGNIAEIKSNNHVAYCFAEVAGFSKFGSYTGTGVNGNFISTGFEPAFLMVKRTNAADNWVIVDNKRGTSNSLFPDDSSQELSNSGAATFSSTGFTVNGASGGWNNSSSTYIYMAFANQF